MKKVLLMLLVSFGLVVLSACGEEGDASGNSDTKADDEINVDSKNPTNKPKSKDDKQQDEAVEYEEELSTKDQMIQDVVDLIDEEKAYDTGSYSKGDIPEGKYAFVKFEGSGEYYSEEEPGGNIVDNENFDSFGYVKVQGVGNVQTDGALIDIDELDELDVSGARELYEKLNDDDDYNASGWYEVGIDIDPGEYVIESHGEGYVAVLSGPVGDNEIVNNENFNGSYTVNVEEGQYLNISSAKIKDE